MPNKRAVVRGHEITVSLDNPNGTISVFVRAPSGKGVHKVVDLGPLLAAGITTDVALQLVVGTVGIGIDGAELQDG